MNIEEKEQLLKDMAANVGYDLIQNPFGTPFAEKSIENLPDCKQFFWTVPATVLNSKEHEEFRKMCIEADIIDTVCTTSLTWPTDENDCVAILLIDVARRRRGSIKFVDASDWDISNETGMATVCNMLVHDLFPGESHLAFQMDVDVMDEELDDKWDDQVRIIASYKIKSSLSPQDYLPNYVAKKGFKYVRLDEVFCIVDLESAKMELKFELNKTSDIVFGYTVSDNMLTLKVPAIVVSSYGNLQPQKVVPETTSANVDLTKKIVLIPLSNIQKIDLDSLLEQMGKESTIRQLPFVTNPNIPLEEDHLKRVLIEIPELN